MKHATFINRDNCHLHSSSVRQRGGILIESLIGLLILGLVGGGIMHSTARVMVAQRDMKELQLVTGELRNMLTTGTTTSGLNLCNAGVAPALSLPGNEEPQVISINGCQAVPLSISGVSIGNVAQQTQTVQSRRPLVLEFGSGEKLVRLGGKIEVGDGS